MTNFFNLTFISISRVPAVYGISRSTVYRWIESGKLPQPTKVSERIVGWSKETLDAIFLTA